jgi:hypothetical protein
MALLSLRHIGDRDGEPIPVGGRVAAIILLMITLTVITVCLCELSALLSINDEIS